MVYVNSEKKTQIHACVKDPQIRMQTSRQISPRKPQKSKNLSLKKSKCRG
jgi:hypothetical protein